MRKASYIACPFCESEDVEWFFDKDKRGRWRDSKGPPLAKCLACRQFFAVPEDVLRSLPRRPVVLGRIVESSPCAHCGYDLRTLRIGGRCPECGHVIDEPQAPPLGANLPRSYYVALFAFCGLCLAVGAVLRYLPERIGIVVVWPLLSVLTSTAGFIAIRFRCIPDDSGCAYGRKAVIAGVAMIVVGVLLAFVWLLVLVL